MRKSFVFALAALFAAALPAVADAKGHKKKKAAKPAAAAQVNTNESGPRLVRDGLMQIFVPGQSIVAASQPKPEPKAKKGKKKKM